MPKSYQENDLHFLYPDNWSLEDEPQSQAAVDITLQSPSSGFWNLQVYPPQTDPDVPIQQISQFLNSDYQDLESFPCRQTFMDYEFHGAEMNFYCLDLVVTAKVCGIQLEDRSLVIHWQAETREFDELEPVFQAITTSLMQSMDRQTEIHP